MNNKLISRIQGIIYSLAWSSLGYTAANTLLNADYSLFLSESSLEKKIIAGIYVGLLSLSIPASIFGTVSGIVNSVKGEMDYFSLSSWTKKGLEETNNHDSLDN